MVLFALLERWSIDPEHPVAELMLAITLNQLRSATEEAVEFLQCRRCEDVIDADERIAVRQ